MKVLSVIIVIILMIQGDSYHDFINIFPKIKYDENGNFLSRQLSAKTYSNLAKEYNLVPNNLSFKYICNNDSSNFKYEYGLYNMDEDRYTEFVTEIYNHYAICSWKKEKYSAFIYSRFDNNTDRFVLKTLSNQGNYIDELIINEYKYEGSGITPEFFSFSLINSDSVKVFTFNDAKNPYIGDKVKPLITKVVIEDYVVDSLGKFNKVAVDSTLLSKPLRAYTEFIHMPEGDDPARKYWTLW